MDRKYTIYEHVSKDGKRYIGITSQKLRVRWRNGEGYAKNIHFYRSIQKYGWDNFQHNIIAENIDEENTKKMEKELIKKYNTTNPLYGYNITDGGETRQPCPEHVKKILSEKLKGVKKSEETKKKISEAAKKRKYGKLTEETKKKISKSLIGNKCALGCNSNAKTIAMCDMNNNILKIFNGAKEAGEYLNCCSSGINYACRENMKNEGLDKTKYGGIYYGYKWFYVDENNKIINNNFGMKKNKRNTPIIQYTLTNEKIMEYDKMKDIMEKYNFTSTFSVMFSKKNEIIYGGFLWVKKEE